MDTDCTPTSLCVNVTWTQSEHRATLTDILSQLHTHVPCLVDLNNLGQPSVQELPRDIDDCVIWIFRISSLPNYVFKARNHLLTFLLSYFVRGTSSTSSLYPGLKKLSGGRSNEAILGVPFLVIFVLQSLSLTISFWSDYQHCKDRSPVHLSIGTSGHQRSMVFL